jgi:integrase
VAREATVKKERGVFEKVPGSGTWWVRYVDASGKLRREKVGTKSAAINLYRKRKTEAMAGKKLPENLRSVTRVSDLAPAILRDYAVNGRKSRVTVERRLRKHILPFFGDMAADDVSSEDFNRYVDRRKKTGAENGTINRELAVVKRMYRLARTGKPSRVREIPVFARLKENPPRQGFVEDRNYTLLMGHARELWLKAILAVAYTFGFRKSELLLQMKVKQVDLETRSLSLYAGATKNDESRVIKMTEEVYELLRACVAGKSLDDHVFTRENGDPVLDFRGAWWALCKKAALGKFVKRRDRKGRDQNKWQGLLFHDLRRSAVRNMVRCGVPEPVAMKLSGHKTRSVFERYNIVSESDITEAAHKIERARQRNLGTDHGKPTDTRTDTGSKRVYEAYVMAAD